LDRRAGGPGTAHTGRRRTLGFGLIQTPRRQGKLPPTAGSQEGSRNGCDEQPRDFPLEALNLSARSYNALKRVGITRLEQLAQLQRDHLLCIPNLGERSIRDIELCLAKLGFELGMPLDDPRGQGLGLRPRTKTHVTDTGLPHANTSPGLARDLALEELNLSVRSYNSLKRAGVRTAEQLAQLRREDLLSIRNMGEGSVRDIERCLADAGLELGMSPDEVRQVDPMKAKARPEMHLTRDTAPLLGPREEVPERARRILELREEGRTLAEIGDVLGITRERVRQLEKRWDRRAPEERAAHRSERAADAVRIKRAQVLDAFRRGERVTEIARDLGLRTAAVTAFLRGEATPADRSLRRAARFGALAYSRTYSDLDLLDSIRQVSEQLGRTPSTNDYSKLAAQSTLPSVPTIMNRFGSWSQAVSAAGLRPNASLRTSYTRKWTDAAVLHALKALVRELGEFPSVGRYEVLAISDDRLPSTATVRNRLGRWSKIAGRLAVLPDPEAVLDRLGLTGESGEGRQEGVWLAYLSEDLELDELEELLAAGLFRWDNSYGAPPPQLLPYLG
jgi:predicted transcriptional regulator